MVKIAFGCDHAAANHRDKIIFALKNAGHAVIDFGCEGISVCDYPDKAEAVAKAVANGEADKGILICGTGIGMSIAANKFPGIRAAVSWNEQTASLASEHNAANILCLGARFASIEQMLQMITLWLKVPASADERHVRRIEKITAIEKKVKGGKHAKRSHH